MLPIAMKPVSGRNSLARSRPRFTIRSIEMNIVALKTRKATISTFYLGLVFFFRFVLFQPGWDELFFFFFLAPPFITESFAEFLFVPLVLVEFTLSGKFGQHFWDDVCKWCF